MAHLKEGYSSPCEQHKSETGAIRRYFRVCIDALRSFKALVVANAHLHKIYFEIDSRFQRMGLQRTLVIFSKQQSVFTLYIVTNKAIRQVVKCPFPVQKALRNRIFREDFLNEILPRVRQTTTTQDPVEAVEDV